MDDPRTNDYDDYDIYDDESGPAVLRKANRERKRRSQPAPERRTRLQRRQARVEARDGTFRCKHCKTMVGVPLSGGRHRNHCPLCLYSRHVDRSMPGDRAADCRSMMEPVGLSTRRDGEQMLVHRCKGCDVIRHNRVAADDNVVATMRLPILTYGAEIQELEEVRDQSVSA